MDATLRVSRVVQVSFKPCAVFESYVGGPEGVGSMQQKGFLESIVRQRDPFLFFCQPLSIARCSKSCICHDIWPRIFRPILSSANSFVQMCGDQSNSIFDRVNGRVEGRGSWFGDVV